MDNRTLKDIKPTEVFKYFEKLTQIPRGSGDEKAASDYLVNFAKEHNLECIQDKALNVIIKKKATAGYENSPAIVIQGHMDIVCEKDASIEHDFTKDPLKLRVDGDMLYATGTTLGADNGIAVAMGLAILASDDIAHPQIELVATTSEETGMDGAQALDPKNVEGRILINIDSEEEGTLLVSCAGGLTSKTTIAAEWEDVDSSLKSYVLKVRGLKGGHSGMEIDKGRANASKLMGRILKDISKDIEFKLNGVSGGAKHNAITREADAVIYIKAEDKAKVEEKLKALEEVFKEELRTPDPDVRVEMEELKSAPLKVFSDKAKDSVVNFLYLIPNGVMSMSMDIKGLVESSLNLGIVLTNENGVEFTSAVRSSVRSIKEEIYSRIQSIADLVGGKVTQEAGYPEWAYNPDSKIRTIFEEVYEKINGKKPHITAIHAGLECGLFGEKFGNIDMISFGPNLYDVHTPNEHLSISSVQRTWDYLLEVLKSIN